jgi:hypothetical protein
MGDNTVRINSLSCRHGLEMGLHIASKTIKEMEISTLCLDPHLSYLLALI